MQSNLEYDLRTILNEKETKILPENIRKGVKILDVEGNYEGSDGSYIPEHPVKIYSSIEELQADTDIVRDTVGLVYNSTGEPLKVGSKFRYITFPETVILPSKMKDEIDMTENIIATDDTSPIYIDMCILDSSGFYFHIWLHDYITMKIEYESSDGITYTRTNFQLDDKYGNLGDVYTEFEIINEWDERVNHFMNTGSAELIGIYKAKGTDDFDTPLTSEVKLENGEIKIHRKSYSHFIERNKLISLIKSLYETEYSSHSNFKCSVYMYNNKWMCAFVLYKTSASDTVYDFNYYMENNVLEDGTIDTTSISSFRLGEKVIFDTVYLYELDFEDQTYVEVDTSEYIVETKSVTYTVPNGNSYEGRYLNTNIPTDTMLLSVSMIPMYGMYGARPAGLKSPDATIKYDISLTAYQSGNGTYEIAPTQLTLIDTSKLAKGEIAYGKEHVVEGTLEEIEITQEEYTQAQEQINDLFGEEETE